KKPEASLQRTPPTSSQRRPEASLQRSPEASLQRTPETSFHRTEDGCVTYGPAPAGTTQSPAARIRGSAAGHERLVAPMIMNRAVSFPHRNRGCGPGHDCTTGNRISATETARKQLGTCAGTAQGAGGEARKRGASRPRRKPCASPSRAG